MPPRRAAAAKAAAAIAQADSSPPASPAPVKRTASSKGKVKRAKTESDDEEDAATSTATVSVTSTSTSAVSAAPADEPKLASVIVKGKAAVDSFCHFASSYHVYTDASGPWDFTGNQTNIGNNNNKFYIIQLLESDTGSDYKVWTRWGRVGVPGQNSFLPGSTLQQCKVEFEKKFKDKTSNNWSNRAHFVKVAGKYDLVQIDYAADDTAEIESALAVPKPIKPKIESKLAPQVKSLMELIFDEKRMTDAIVEMKYDVKKLPLGKLTTQQIKAGYEALKEIENCVKLNKGRSALEQACSDFYTRIPHVFGMQRPPLIQTFGEVKEKLELLEALGDIKIALSLIKSGDSDEQTVAAIDAKYKSLNIDLTPLAAGSDEFDMIQKYIKNTHGTTHNNYTLDLLDAFVVGKAQPFKPEIGNRQLLWHGSRLTNWVGIFSQGLRIAPPEAPCTGYMFGKGVYFADMVSKSANYCFTSKSNNIGILLLCEVALGTQNQLLDADNNLHDHMPKGTHSTFGMGQVAPDPASTITTADGVKVPLGKGVSTGVKNPRGFTLMYNEFIVYDTAQVKFKYALKVRFNHRY